MFNERLAWNCAACAIGSGRFLHLVDARETAVQSQWASERLNNHSSSDGGMQDQDWTTVVVNSALVKMQVA